VVADDQPEAHPLGAPGDDGERQAGGEHRRRQELAQAVVGLLERRHPVAHLRHPRQPGEEGVRAAPPAEEQQGGGHQRHPGGGDPGAAGHGQRAEGDEQHHAEEVGRPLGEHRRDHRQGAAAAQLAHQPRLAQLAGLARRHREHEADEEDAEAGEHRQPAAEVRQVELPAGEAQPVIDQRQGEHRDEQRRVEGGDAGGELPGIGEQRQPDERDDGERRGHQQAPAEPFEPWSLNRRCGHGRGGGSRASLARRGGRRRGGRRRCDLRRVRRNAASGVLGPPQAAASFAGRSLDSGYSSKSRIHFEVFL
jgi:hypothetical protein